MAIKYSFFLKPVSSVKDYTEPAVQKRLGALEDILPGTVTATEYGEEHAYRGVWRCTSSVDPETLKSQFLTIGRVYYGPGASIDDLRTTPAPAQESPPAASHSSEPAEQ